MYKVLIVDDEPFILDGLPHVINWEEHGAEIAASARNGEEALTILEQQNIHIVITDIKMPGTNGLQLIEAARNRGVQAKFIVLSGYDEFELVKKAVIYGVENYLLKPLEEEELSDTLLTTIEKLDHEVHLSIQNKQNYSIVMDNILYRWVSGQIGQEELVNRAEFLHIDLSFERYQVGVVHNILQSCNSVTKAEIGSRIESTIEMRMGTGIGIGIRTGTGKGTERGIGTGAAIEPLKDPLPYAILNICEETIHGYGNCLLFKGINGIPILLFAWRGESESCSEHLASLLERCVEHVRAYLKLDIIISLGTVEHDYRHVKHSYHSACKKLELTEGTSSHSSKVEDSHPIITRVIGYIEENYSQELSLKTLSYHFNMNAAYLGQLFKKATGEMFSNYLNQIRIEKAKQLLADPQMKASEIAGMVGFSSVQYFSNVFFKYTGFYPTDFKKHQVE